MLLFELDEGLKDPTRELEEANSSSLSQLVLVLGFVVIVILGQSVNLKHQV